MKLINAPYIDQTKDWPTGCESVSTVMLLQYLGIDITVENFVDQYLEKAPLYEKDGQLYGPNPWEVFAGSPRDDGSMGCYAPVIVKALKKVFREKTRKEPREEIKDTFWAGQRAGQEPRQKKECGKTQSCWEPVNLTGVPMERLLEEYIDRDIPVIFWASIDLKETVTGPDWFLEETGEVFTWRSNEHCMLLVGYDETGYYFNDPWHNHGVIRYEKKLVERRHQEQYKMAVSIKKNSI